MRDKLETSAELLYLILKRLNTKMKGDGKEKDVTRLGTSISQRAAHFGAKLILMFASACLKLSMRYFYCYNITIAFIST